MITITYKCGHCEQSDCYDEEKKEIIDKLLYHIRNNRICVICYMKEQAEPKGETENIASSGVRIEEDTQKNDVY